MKKPTDETKRLTPRQKKALDLALRILDDGGYYSEGDELRKAFSIELNGLRSYEGHVRRAKA